LGEKFILSAIDVIEKNYYYLFH